MGIYDPPVISERAATLRIKIEMFSFNYGLMASLIFLQLCVLNCDYWLVVNIPGSQLL